MMKKTFSLNLQFLILFSLAWLNPIQANAEELIDIIRNGKFYGDLRYRYEHVNQDGFSKDATASTFRSRLGLISGKFMGFQGAAELDTIGTIGTSRYNSTINGKRQYPVVADPHTNELNALWMSWEGLYSSKVKVGRQPINLDNLRFIGTVGFRQNDQTYDSVVVTNKGIKGLELFYNFTHRVNRIFGHKSRVGRFHTETHMGRAAYEFLPNQKLIAYTYWLNFNRTRSSALSSKTYGLRLTGSMPLPGISNTSVAYVLEGARQHDNGHNPNNYQADYYNVSPSITWRTLTIGAGIESLGGNGRNAFSTPLATLHKHNGWADKFLVTPADGLQDRHLRIKYKVAGLNNWVNNTVIQLIYHDFNAVKGSSNYGNEWNARIFRVFTAEEIGLPYVKKLSIGLKYADYDAKDFNVDTRKGWFTLGAQF